MSTCGPGADTSPIATCVAARPRILHAHVCTLLPSACLLFPLQVSMEDFRAALDEVKPAFGAVTETLETYRLHGIIDFGPRFQHLLSCCKTLVQQVGRTGLHGAAWGS
jgi:hypothetical protein